MQNFDTVFCEEIDKGFSLEVNQITIRLTLLRNQNQRFFVYALVYWLPNAMKCFFGDKLPERRLSVNLHL